MSHTLRIYDNKLEENLRLNTHTHQRSYGDSFNVLQMGLTQDINIHSRLTVVPNKPTAAKKIHPLSYLDHITKLHTVKATYYYDTSSVKDRSSLLDGLKNSLCKSLSTYPLFAGRLQKKEDGTWEVKCNDAGVRIYEAKCELTLAEFFSKCKKDHKLEFELNRMEINADHTITPVSVIQVLAIDQFLH